MINRSRIKIAKQVTTITCDLDGSIPEAIAYLQKLHETYPNARLDYEDISSGYDPERQMGISVYIDVDETDAEYASRIAREEHYEKLNAENERKQYAALKKKFEK